MLDTRTTERDIKGNWKDRNEQRNFFLLKKYGREVRDEYDSALIKFDEDQKEYLAIETKLGETLMAAKKEKAGLLKSKQDYALKYEEVVWESAKMKQKLAEQQDKINIYKDKKHQVDVGQDSMKKENLILLKEIELREAQRQDGLQLLASKLAELKESQQKVAFLRQANNEKRKEGKRCTLKTDETEQQNMKMLNKIGILDEQIQENTSCIEAQLKKQGDLARRYGDLKRHRKELAGAVKQLTVELSEEQRINQQLTDAEYNLNLKNNYIHQQIITNKQEIAELISSSTHQKSQISTNKDCLLKLQRHLSILKQQNKQVEHYMQQVIEQDYQIKSIIDRKHKTCTKTPVRQLFKDITQNTCESSLSSTMS